MHPRPLAITGSMLYLLSVVPSFPALPLIAIGTVLFALARYVDRRRKAEHVEQETKATQSSKPKEGSDLPPLLDILELELGYGLIPLVDESQNGDLLPRIKAIRQQLALEYGILVPALHVRDNLQLKPAEYRLLTQRQPGRQG